MPTYKNIYDFMKSDIIHYKINLINLKYKLKNIKDIEEINKVSKLINLFIDFATICDINFINSEISKIILIVLNNARILQKQYKENEIEYLKINFCINTLKKYYEKKLLE